ncbi:molecular chaperone TorD family protein [Desulfogranum marinum]|jgi:TorA maturation chaperone TorD|uniref:TorD/DmsD family molecular chaperone n=1 Tax=Desulfogranum marinum TaxID=453220 RepID=UPI0029C62315|nr:molecular chaperone TorD family protein [Desulfogranum marinum]
MHSTESQAPKLDPELSTEASLLSEIYGFLALAMRYPDSSFLDGQFLDAYEALLQSLEWKEEYADMQKWRSQTGDFLNDLQIEYTQLFINASPGTTIPPYASVYMDGDRSIQGKTTEKIKDFYRSCGYEVTSSTEPPDHIQHELEFLAALAGENRREEETLFLHSLFRPWFIRFLKHSIQEARHPFYRVSIQLIDFFTKEEQ